MVLDYLRERLNEKLRDLVLSTEGVSPAARTKLTTGIENIISSEIDFVQKGEIESGEVNLYKVGPVLSDGRKYSAEKMLDMATNEFLELHRKLPDGKYALKRYFRNAVGYLQKQGKKRQSFTVREVLALPAETVRGPGVKKYTIAKVSEFFKRHYGLQLGVYYQKA